MNPTLTIIFLEDSFECSIFPNESAWEELRSNGDGRNLLYFYLSEGRIRNDEFARDRFAQGHADAYGNFYELVLHPDETFERFGVPQEPVQLLRDAIEAVRTTYFERMGNFHGGLESNNRVPVNLCFVPGVSAETSTRIASYLHDEGFEVVARCDYFEAIIAILQKRGLIQNSIAMAVVESHFGDLYFNYLEFAGGIQVNESEVLVGKGVDHRIGNLATILVEKAARQCVSGILNDKALMALEIKRHHRQAALDISRFEYKELSTKVELSDFNAARVIVDQADLDRMSSETLQFLKFKFESFISRHSNLARTERILLRGAIFESDELVRFLERSFGASKIIRPMENFLELLSRGVFAVAQARLASTPHAQVKQVTIEIRVTETPLTAPARPPLPQTGKPPVPPSIARPPLPSAAKPPVPPAARPPVPPAARPPVPPTGKPPVPPTGKPPVPPTGKPPVPPPVIKPTVAEATKPSRPDLPRPAASTQVSKPALPPAPQRKTGDVARPVLPEPRRPPVPEVKRPPAAGSSKLASPAPASRRTDSERGSETPDRDGGDKKKSRDG